MTEREMLELAAKAAGLRVVLGKDDFDAQILQPDAFYVRDEAGIRRQWNPLTDDGDALRLARRLDISIEFLPDAVRCKAPSIEWIGETCLPCDTEHLGAAHRKAIVRAAAELGRTMKEESNG